MNLEVPFSLPFFSIHYRDLSSILLELKKNDSMNITFDFFSVLLCIALKSNLSSQVVEIGLNN